MTRGEGKRRVFPRYALREDVDRELHTHVELCVEELVNAGWDPEEARAEAERRLGNPRRVARRCRAITRGYERRVRRERMMDSITHDLRHAVRNLIKRPGFALVSISILALAIAANVTVFSLVDGVLLEPLPYESPEELVWVAERMEGGGSNWVTWPNFRDWRAEARSFQGLTAYGRTTTTVLGGSRPAYAGVALVSRDFWTVFPVTPVVGRLTADEDHREGGAPVAVVSETFAMSVLGGAQATGRVIETMGTTYEVVGVIPASFDFPAGIQVWVPIELIRRGESRTAHNWRVVGRLHQGLRPEDAFMELDPLTQRLVATAEEDWASEWLAVGVTVTSLQDQIVGGSGRLLVLLMGAAGLVLLVACTNLASTLLARGTTRIQEVAVRSALGANRGRIVRQFLVEAGLLATLGGAAGLGVTYVVVGGVRTMGAGSIPRLESVALDGTVLLFTLAVISITAVAFGLLPAIRNTEDNQAQTLRSEGRGTEGYRGRMWGTLVATEVALALVLLTGSGLLIRSFNAVLTEEPGFDGTDIALSPVDLSGIKYPDHEAHVRFWEGMLEQAHTIPGVSAVGVMSSLPVSGFIPNGQFALDGDPSSHANGNYVVASAGLFETLDIALLQGRVFDERDGPDAPHVVVVNRSFAETYWPGEDPIGRQVSGGGMDSYWNADPPVFGTVVGVVEDVRFRDLTRVGRPSVFWNYRQRPSRIMDGAYLLVESASGDPALVARGLREEIRTADPDVAVDLEYLDDRVGNSLATRRFTLLVMTGFAIVALLLTALGVYGVVSYAVARRTREMGIRIALGATGMAVRGMVLCGAMGPVVLGVVLGVGGAWALSRIMVGLLYDVSPSDPVTYAGVVTLLLITGLAASWVPTLRSTRVDPVITMREE